MYSWKHKEACHASKNECRNCKTMKGMEVLSFWEEAQRKCMKTNRKFMKARILLQGDCAVRLRGGDSMGSANRDAGNALMEI